MIDQPGYLGYRPFLSYARLDQELALRLAAALRARGLDPWIDIAELRPGQEWEGVVERAVAESTSVIVLCTPRLVPKQLRREWDFARWHGVTIVPVLWGVTDPPDPLAGLHPIMSNRV
ncbi:MAG: toll/interleukin-1 receptor domain-containing protein, partial [Pseudonocardiaceae bacterium]